MPSIYTHSVFAKDVKKNLSKEIQELIDQKNDYYIMFSQSFDNLYYYNFLNLKKGKHIRDLGSYCHNHKVNKYFMNMIKYIKENNLKNNPEVLCYLFGSINHYISDSTLHPFISYRTGRYYKNRKETKKYKGIHTNTEIKIDAYYYNKETGKDYKKFKIYKDFIPKLNYSKQLKDTINYTFKETYNIDNMGNIFNKSYNQSKIIYRVLMYDPTGIKTFAYKCVDYLTPFKDRVAISYSLHKDPIDEKFFNKKHNHWCNPVDMDLISDESWDDVYIKAVKKATKLIEESYKYLYGKIKEEKLAKAIGNNSYTTGIDLKDKRIDKYFEF